jgi:hypothetical protein
MVTEAVALCQKVRQMVTEAAALCQKVGKMVTKAYQLILSSLTDGTCPSLFTRSTI